MIPYNNLENKVLSDICWRGQLVCMKFQAQLFGTITGIQSGSDAFDIKAGYDLFNQLGSYRNMQCEIISRRYIR